MPGMFDKGRLREVKRQRKEWEQGPLKQSLDRFGAKGSPNKFYTPLDIADSDFLDDVGFPGQYPFTAGAYPSQVPGSGPVTGGYHIGGGGGLVRAGRYLGYGTAEDTRDYYRSEIKRGRTGGPNIAFDLPTQIGLDSDDPQAQGEVGKTGVAFDTLDDFAVIYEPFQGGNNLDKIASNWTINAPANVILAAYIALAERRGIPLNKLRGTLQNDILKEYIARGTYIFPPRHSLRLTRDIIVFCTGHLPSLNPISISGYHMREAGASRVQALAFTMANAMAYLQLGVAAGLDVDTFVPRFTFNTLSGGMEVLKEICARRASRRMWAKIMRDRFKSKNPRNWTLREAGGFMTGCWTATPQRPLNNLTRAVIGGVAGALAGYIPSVEPPYDEPLGLGWSIEAQQLAEDAARIIHYEAKLSEVTDPLAGSYYIEAMTNRIEGEAWGLIEKIDGMGGAVGAIENGFMSSAIAQKAYEFQRKLETGEETVTGVNAFTGEQEIDVLPNRMVPYPYDPVKRARAEAKQVRKLSKVRKQRDGRRVKRILTQLKEAAGNDKINLMPLTIEAVKAYATIGEICGTLKEVFGEYSAYGRL
ncbi:MAG: methylmalonyl-CoA mutase family protein [Chloroflexota bacterium]